ncbi:hypothetical protein McanMca71_006093 [Microsporum canis]|uniref:Aminoglycoside phosphotransferase domain-containing protein n=1 Tax=Arthroderma otae (strain ATCC MYA-4605 / CBS 113480) TaxID=554155 RepID=C5FNJ2_ARTOC|nr:uncharacterized protein MCYG_04425 [Microsporum canis CBS 113480]EEQ31606.1 predicted protein [Microsporum canis CBS 113480]
MSASRSILRPSYKWTGFRGLDQDSEGYKQMQKVLASADFEYLKSRAILLRAKAEILPADITCTIDTTRFACGFNNIVLEVAFSDSVYWVARIQYRRASATGFCQDVMLSEVATMRLVRSRTPIPAPEIFDYDISENNPCGYPYILAQCLPGQTCDGPIAKSAPPHCLPKIARQLANVFFEFQKISFDSIGPVMPRRDAGTEYEVVPINPGARLPQTSLEYFYKDRLKENERIITAHPGDSDWLTACWVLKLATDHTYINNRINGPFPLCHLDLHYGNLLFDEEFNLTGVLDWSHAQTMPLERLALCPEFIAFPGLSDEENRSIIEFKTLVIQSLKELETNANHSRNLTSLSDYMESPRAEIAYLCQFSNSRQALWFAKRACKLMFGEEISWDQLKRIYGMKRLD